MSEAFKCDYCKKLFEGKPSRNLPELLLNAKSKYYADRDVKIMVGNETWVLRDWGRFNAYANGVCVDLCSDCKEILFRHYAEKQLQGKKLY